MRFTITFVSTIFVCAFANAEELGRWCDTPLPGINEYDVKFELRGDTTKGFALIQTFWDRSKTTEHLIRNGFQFHPISKNGRYYRLREDGALEAFSKGEIEYVLKAGSFPKSTSLGENISDSSVCY